MEKVWFIDAMRLIQACIDCGILKTYKKGCEVVFENPPEDEDALVGRVFIYREASADYEEGWWLETKDDIAQELMHDADGITALMEALAEKGIDFDLNEGQREAKFID